MKRFILLLYSQAFNLKYLIWPTPMFLSIIYRRSAFCLIVTILMRVGNWQLTKWRLPWNLRLAFVLTRHFGMCTSWLQCPCFFFRRILNLEQMFLSAGHRFDENLFACAYPNGRESRNDFNPGLQTGISLRHFLFAKQFDVFIFPLLFCNRPIETVIKKSLTTNFKNTLRKPLN